VLDLQGSTPGNGWLIFKLPQPRSPCIPTDGTGKHEFYLMCGRPREDAGGPDRQGCHHLTPAEPPGLGLLASMKLPSGSELSIYQPRHPTAYDLEG